MSCFVDNERGWSGICDTCVFGDLEIVVLLPEARNRAKNEQLDVRNPRVVECRCTCRRFDYDAE